MSDESQNSKNRDSDIVVEDKQKKNIRYFLKLNM